MLPAFRHRRTVALLAALSVVTAACGDGDDTATADAAAAATSPSTPGPAATGTSAAADTTTADTTTDTAADTADTAATSSAAAVQLPEIPSDEQVTISFESYNFLMAGPGADTINQLVDEFEAAHPNITVERRSPPNIQDMTAGLQQQIAAGDPPSLSQMSFNLDLAANQLGVKSWDDTVGEAAIDAYFDGSLGGQHPVHPRAATLGDLNGKTYLLPFVFSTPTLFINRTLFEEAGLDPDAPPTTWDEVRAAAEAITSTTDAGGVYVSCTGPSAGGWCYQAILRSNGAVPISDDLSTIDIDSPEAVEATEMLGSLVADGLHPDVADEDAGDQFLRGQLGMYLQSSVYTGSVLAASAANGWEMDATGLPAFGDRPIVPTNSGSGLGMLAEDPLEQRAAWELAEFLTSDHAYTLITSKIGYLPLRVGIVEEADGLEPWLAEHPFLQTNLDQLDDLQPWLYAPGAQGAQITKVWMDAVNEVIFQGADGTATLAEAQARAEELMP